MKAVLLGLVLLLGLLLVAHCAAAQTYIATEVGQPCPPNSTPVKLQDGRWVCAVTSTLTPLENPMKDSK
jgi:hypothetical protein